MAFIPRVDHLHVRLSKAAKMSKGGILLPEVVAHQATEGVVLATGPGHYLAETARRAIVWLLPGDTVLFPQHAFRVLEGDEGLVREEDVVATVDTDTGGLEPEGEWVLVAPDARPSESAGGIAYTDRGGDVPRSGVVRAVGPGVLRLTGPFAGLRQPVWRLLNLANAGELADRRVYWATDARTLHTARHALVRGRDLVALEA